MTAAPQTTPDWFDVYWAKNAYRLPVLFRGETTKELCRGLIKDMLAAIPAQAASAEGLRTVVAFARIALILKGAQGVLDSPDPSPDQVADAVQRLVDRVKP
jgi:hypothetical protein